VRQRIHLRRFSKSSLLKLTVSHSVPLTQLQSLFHLQYYHLIFSDQISVLSKSCYYHICALCCIHPSLEFKIASIIATSVVHSELDYCNLISVTLYYSLPKSQINHLQWIQNSLAHAVVMASKFCHYSTCSFVIILSRSLEIPIAHFAVHYLISGINFLPHSISVV